MITSRPGTATATEDACHLPTAFESERGRVALAEQMTDDTLDDFIHDDVSKAMLRPSALHGVLWSGDTRRPPGTDTDYLLACSRPVEGRTGIYRIAV